MTIKRLRYPWLLAAVLASGACSFDLNTSPNSPDAIGPNPSRLDVQVRLVGMLIAFRQDFADYPLDLGIIAREVYRFDGSDPRFTGELLHGPLDAGSDAFGGDHWADQYASIRGGNMVLAVLPTAEALSEEERNGVSAYVKTIQALNYLLILNAHTQDQIPIVTDTSVVAPPAAFGSNDAAWDNVIRLLDEAATELATAGPTFSFSLPSGFTGFNNPEGFLQFNRALRARVAVYRNDFAGALTALEQSFIDPAGLLDVGVYMDYGTGPGDLANPLSIDPQQGENFVHPSLADGVQLQVDGVTPDERFRTKTVARTIQSSNGLTSALGWTRYPAPTTPIPIIKNEELILLRAEAFIGLGDLTSALTDINTVRTRSGLLAELATLGTPEQALDELLYNKLYSLMFEGAHRWIDARHYGRLETLPIDRPTGDPPDVVFSTLLIPTDETNAH
jgi:starch-binding outer membrane protein, SusD/RagB family